MAWVFSEGEAAPPPCRIVAVAQQPLMPRYNSGTGHTLARWHPKWSILGNQPVPELGAQQEVLL